MKKRPHILIVEDDNSLRGTMKDILRRRHYQVTESATIGGAHRHLKENFFDLILLDLTLPDGSGLDILQKISMNYRNRIIVISGTGTIDTAVEAMRRGAYDFLEKPVERDVLLVTIKKSIALNQDLDDYRKLKEEIRESPTFKRIIHKSKAMTEVIKKARESAKNDKTVLITGETGTGKDLIANAIHNASERRKNPFITVNCAAIPVNLAESELFGFEKGAFTGADNAYPGKFLVADKGTIFLDEIGELHPEIQPKLLRVLESGEIMSLKSTRSKKIDLRVIAATNKLLDGPGSSVEFRNDLYYRIEEINIRIPPLRERKSDVVPLVEHFIQLGNITYNKEIRGIDEEAKEMLTRYRWPGNVRELKNTIDEIIAFIRHDQICAHHLPAKLRNRKNAARQQEEFISLDKLEKEHVRRVLQSTNFNIQLSAKILGIGRPALYRKMKRYGFEKH